MKEKLRDFFHIVGLDIRRWDDMSVFSRQLTHILKHFKIDLVLDVGAHWGEYAEMLFRHNYKENILSVEPVPKNRDILDKKTGVRKNWRFVTFAASNVTDMTTLVKINIAGGNNSSSSLLPMSQAHIDVAPHTAYVEQAEIFRYRMDDYVKTHYSRWLESKNIFLKIDTQGYEMKVLEGSTGIIDRVKGIQVELSTEELYKGQALDQEIIEWLSNYGFKLWALNPFLYNQKTGKLLQYDAIFVRE